MAPKWPPAELARDQMRLSYRFVETAALGEYRDDNVRGLVLRVKLSGTRSWALRYVRSIDGKRQRHTIGPFPAFSLEQARIEARDLLATIARGGDPKGEELARSSSLTFRQLAELMLEKNKKLAENTRNSYREIFVRDVFPVIGEYPAAAVVQKHVRQLQKAVAARGAIAKADRLRSVVGSVYRWSASHHPIAGMTGISAGSARLRERPLRSGSPGRARRR